MSEFATLLPPSMTTSERAIEKVMAERELGLELPIGTLWNAETCPPNILPWLAWAFSVDHWDASWPEGTKRNAVAASISIHRRKGTVRSIREALAAFGFGDAAIIEGYGGFQHTGALTYDGAEDHGEPDHWAEYRVYLERPITIDQADQVKAILRNVAPARCRLKGLYFTQAANRYNAALTFDGAYSHGVAA